MRSDVSVFIADIEREIGPRPPGRTPGGKPVYSLDRKDNDGHYEPGNVKWSTAKEQAANQRPHLDALQTGRAEWWANREPRTEVCEFCGDKFLTRQHASKVRFCSPRCAQAKRKAGGTAPSYDEERTCHVCGSTFMANKYGNARHCSRSHAATCRWSGGCPR